MTNGKIGQLKQAFNQDFFKISQAFCEAFPAGEHAKKSFDAVSKTPNYALRFEIGMTDRQPLDYINGLIPKAKIISPGKIKIKFLFCSIKSCFIAGSNK